MSTVKVCCRFRPQNKREVEENGAVCVKISDDGTLCEIEHPEKSRHPEPMKFVFDRSFAPDTPQNQVFEYAAKHLVDQVFEGYNATIFAYGQTGSGKTFSMEGVLGSPNRGIIPRTVETIFETITNSDENYEFVLKVSYVEIYLENLRDLLEPNNKKMKIRESQNGVYIEGVTEMYVRDAQEVIDLMTMGAGNRTVSGTNMNAVSSRSHGVFMLKLISKHTQTGTTKSSKLMMVDLAGSEKVAKTGASGQLLKEAQKINQSLSALGNVMNSLSTGNGHVPYRDSVLTRLLSDSLGGNCKTTLLIACSPSTFNVDETISTLRFGVRAKKIKNKAKINAEKTVAEYKKELAEAYNKIAKLERFNAAYKHDLELSKKGELIEGQGMVDKLLAGGDIDLEIKKDGDAEEEDGDESHNQDNNNNNNVQSPVDNGNDENKQDNESKYDNNNNNNNNDVVDDEYQKENISIFKDNDVSLIPSSSSQSQLQKNQSQTSQISPKQQQKPKNSKSNQISNNNNVGTWDEEKQKQLENAEQKALDLEEAISKLKAENGPSTPLNTKELPAEVVNEIKRELEEKVATLQEHVDQNNFVIEKYKKQISIKMEEMKKSRETINEMESQYDKLVIETQSLKDILETNKIEKEQANRKLLESERKEKQALEDVKSLTQKLNALKESTEKRIHEIRKEEHNRAEDFIRKAQEDMAAFRKQRLIKTIENNDENSKISKNNYDNNNNNNNNSFLNKNDNKMAKDITNTTSASVAAPILSQDNDLLEELSELRLDHLRLKQTLQEKMDQVDQLKSQYLEKDQDFKKLRDELSYKDKTNKRQNRELEDFGKLKLQTDKLHQEQWQQSQEAIAKLKLQLKKQRDRNDQLQLNDANWKNLGYPQPKTDISSVIELKKKQNIAMPLRGGGGGANSSSSSANKSMPLPSPLQAQKIAQNYAKNNLTIQPSQAQQKVDQLFVAKPRMVYSPNGNLRPVSVTTDYFRNIQPQLDEMTRNNIINGDSPNSNNTEMNAMGMPMIHHSK